MTEEGLWVAVIPDSYDGSEESLEQLRTNVLRSGEVGNLVANNFESTIIYVPLDEVNPETGKKLDYQEFSEKLETLVREKYQSEDIAIHITGFAKLIGDLIEGAEQVGLFFLLLFYYVSDALRLCRCWRSTLRYWLLYYRGTLAAGHY